MGAHGGEAIGQRPDRDAQSAAKRRIRGVVLAGTLSALTILLGLVPMVGLIPVPTPAGSATTMHIPAILGGILGGPVVGSLVGLAFGLFSIGPAAIPVKDPLVVGLPRLFIGVVAWAVYAGALRSDKRVTAALLAVTAIFGAWFAVQMLPQRPALGWAMLALVALAAAVMVYFLGKGSREAIAVAAGALFGSFTNTVLVLGMAWLRAYIPGEGVLLVGITHGIPEAIVAVVISVLVVGAVRGAAGWGRSSV
ncbi:MAG: ECF transporter S component [Anaerolineae bacterium]|nr:ECF transporter S component [Anaerolineae bacterium]